MTGAAGGGPDTAGTDPLVAVVAEALADQFLCRTIPRHRDKPEHLCRTCKEDEARMASVVVAAVRAHQNTTPSDSEAAAQALRDAELDETHRLDTLTRPKDTRTAGGNWAWRCVCGYVGYGLLTIEGAAREWRRHTLQARADALDPS